MKMEETECSETSAHKIQSPGNNPEESIQHLEYGESLKSRILHLYGEETHDVAGRWPATSWVHYTTNCNVQSSAPEDG